MDLYRFLRLVKALLIGFLFLARKEETTIVSNESQKKYMELKGTE